MFSIVFDVNCQSRRHSRTGSRRQGTEFQKLGREERGMKSDRGSAAAVDLSIWTHDHDDN